MWRRQRLSRRQPLARGRDNVLLLKPVDGKGQSRVLPGRLREEVQKELKEEEETYGQCL